MSDNLALLEIGATVSFRVYASQLIPDNFQGCTVEAVLDMDTTKYFNLDAVRMHANVYPYLPDGSIQDASKLKYLKLRLADGSVAVIATSWIDPTTIKLLGRLTLTIVLQDASAEDQAIAQKALSANGLNATYTLS